MLFRTLQYFNLVPDTNLTRYINLNRLQGHTMSIDAIIHSLVSTAGALSNEATASLQPEALFPFPANEIDSEPVELINHGFGIRSGRFNRTGSPVSPARSHNFGGGYRSPEQIRSILQVSEDIAAENIFLMQPPGTAKRPKRVIPTGAVAKEFIVPLHKHAPPPPIRLTKSRDGSIQYEADGYKLLPDTGKSMLAFHNQMVKFPCNMLLTYYSSSLIQSSSTSLPNNPFGSTRSLKGFFPL